jgi:hypothetical protein
MGTTIFPQNDPSPADETSFQDYLLAAVMSHVKYGLEVTIDSGLDVSIAAGEAIVGGVRIEVDTTQTLSMANNDVNYVYLELTRSGGLVQSPTSDADNYTPETSPVLDKNHLLLAVVNTSGGSITQVDDVRWRSPGETLTVSTGNSQTLSGTSHAVLDDIQLPIDHDWTDRVNWEYSSASSCSFLLRISDGGGGISVRSRLRPGGGTRLPMSSYEIYNNGTLVDSGVNVTTASIPTWGGDAIMRIEYAFSNINPFELALEIAEETSSSGVTININSYATVRRVIF